MQTKMYDRNQSNWKVEKIGVIGPGIVGMPMAALLANARIKIGTEEPAKVWVVQRSSLNSGWKVDSINKGISVIGGIEPYLNEMVEKNVKEGYLQASSNYDCLSDADVILVAIQTDKKGFGPDYGPLFSGLTSLAEALQKKPVDKVPLVIFESTLAPSSMTTLIKEHFEKYDLIEGKNILLGNSPNRVMPGRLVERITTSDKLVAGLHPETPKLIKQVYKHIVSEGTIHLTNSLTAEIVKTLENAYRDVRIAFSSEIVRYCDEHDIDFYKVRDEVNLKLEQTDNASSNYNSVPSGGILIPTIGVGGHCLPKDGILLWWRMIENKINTDQSLIIKSRVINDDSPLEAIRLFEKKFQKVEGQEIAILGASYRFNSDDTRNSPSIQLAIQLQKMGCAVTLHDPYVKPTDQNILKYKLESIFTNDLNKAIENADYIIMGTAHKIYFEERASILAKALFLKGIFDGCNIFTHDTFKEYPVKYAGIGRGKNTPEKEFIEFVFKSFRTFETGLANEVYNICDFMNEHYADGEFNRVNFAEVQGLAESCSTGCKIADPGEIMTVPVYRGFSSQLSEEAYNAKKMNLTDTVVL